MKFTSAVEENTTGDKKRSNKVLKEKVEATRLAAAKLKGFFEPLIL